MTYREIINRTKSQLHSSISWWPVCFYHFTDIHNALGILDKGWIYGRNDAVKNSLMQSDNASKSVIDVTNEFVKDYGRLYFRPLTPTQFHNEGYKPEHVRQSAINASCPVPVFFCLDAETVLNTEGVGFVECGLAGKSHHALQQGEEAYANLNFAKIYHNGWFEKGGDITQYRHSEVVRAGGIPTQGAIKRIFCRTPAEKQTLLYLLKNQLPHKAAQASRYIVYSPSLAMFYDNGICVKTVSGSEQGLYIEFNEAAKRYGRGSVRGDGKDLSVSITLYWLHPEKSAIVHREDYGAYLDYSDANAVNVHFEKCYSDRVLAEIFFDGCLMFKSEVDLKTQQLV